MLSKIVSIKVNALFLATVLLLGTIAAFYPSFMVGTAQAQSYYGEMDNNYKTSYGNDNYEPEYSSYGKDNYKSKDNSNTKIVKKIQCNNINVNINGLEFDGIPSFLRSGLVSDDGEGAAADEGQYDTSNYGSNGYDNNNKGFKFVCINNNNNNNIIVGSDSPPPLPPGNPPPVPPEGNANLKVIKHVINDNGGTGTASDFIMSVHLLSYVEGTCKLNPFLPHPSFPGSESGTNVPLLVPDEGICYRVSEDFNPQEIGDYDSSSVGCLDIIRPGETKTCTWTNNDTPNPSG